MAWITQMRLRNVRCFSGDQSANLGRITLLVGENGAGKSTFMGCLRTLAKLENFSGLDDTNHFDDSPFRMGPFGSFVRSGHAEFTVGGRFKDHCHKSASFTFAGGTNGLPEERRVRLEFEGTGKLVQTLDIHHLPQLNALRFEGPGFRFNLDRSEIAFSEISTWLSRYVRHGILPFHGELGEFRRCSESPISGGRDDSFVKFMMFLRSELPLPTNPSFSVESLGHSLPMCKRYYASIPTHLDVNRDPDLRCYFARAGQALNLWSDFSVCRNSKNGNFEVLIGTPNGSRNLVDVGHGIPSLLPMLHVMYKRGSGATFLLQQPETHLHPSVQAGLAQLMTESDQAFVIETHSEHFTDRFRICIMEGTLRPEEFSIVYFEPSQGSRSSKIHSLQPDDYANLQNVPRGYRSFHLGETQRLLGFRD